MKTGKLLKFTILLLILSLGVKSEGLKELANGTTHYPETNFGSNGWADPGAPDELKLYIYIEDPTSESVYFGFQNNGEVYNVYDPNGNLVYTNTSNANCATAAQAIAGPNEIIGTGGYDAQIYTPAAGSPAGNYYIEFDGASNETFWDISVAKAGNSTTELGRLWSMIWWFNMGGWTSDDSFEATMYAYSLEGFVSKVDYKNSNFRPYVFSIYYNANGPGSSGNLEDDRKSIEGANAGTPSFPVFLNPPPEAIMPSATFGDLVATPYITRTAATGPNKFSFNLSSTQPGTFTILLNVENNTVPDVYDDIVNTTDRVLVFDVVPAPGETAPYIRSVPWDGIDGNGNTLADGYMLHYTVYYGDGRSNFPTYDAEYLADGLTVDQVRPTSSYAIELFWDDSNIGDDPNTSTHGDFPNGTTGYHVELNGALSPAHTWVNNDYGNVNTINTWWYCNVKQDTEQVEALPPMEVLPPNIQAYDIVFSEVGNTAMKINWTNGNGVKRVVFINQTNTGQPFPVDNTTYNADPVFGAGDEIGATGWYCVYNDAASPEVVVTGLAEATEYRVMVCEYNNGAGSELYNTNTAVINPANQTTTTLTQATNVTFSNVLSNSMTVDWTNGTGTRRAAFIKLTATPGDALPVNNITYAANPAYGVGDQIGTSGWYCIYNGTGSTEDITNLAANTDYTVMVCEYLGSDGNENYLTTTNATDPNNQVTALLGPAHHIVFTNVTTNSMQIDWTNGDGTDRYVFMKETTSTTDDAFPVDATVYADNTVFGTGDEIGTTGWFCVYSGNGSTVTVTGLNPSTYYRVKVCDYIGAQNFIPGSVPTNPLSQSTYGVTPLIQAHDITFPTTGSNSMEINWINGNGTKRLAFAYQGTTGTPAPIDGTDYNANSGFGLGDEIGASGWYCIYNGTGTSVTMNNLLQATDYRIMVCEYNEDASGPLYNTSTAVLNPENNTTLTTGITVSPISQNTTEIGGTATFTVVLNTQPTNDVNINLATDDPTEGISDLTTLTFTSADWDSPQTVTVTGQDDPVYDGDIAYNIVLDPATSTDVGYDGIDPDDVAVINEDDETYPTVDLTVDVTTIAEAGGVATLTATLNNPTTVDVDVTIGYTGSATGGGTDYTAASTVITITAGNSSNTTTITADDDVLVEGDETVICDITSVTNANENGTQQETVTIIDDDFAPTAEDDAVTIPEDNGATNILVLTDLGSGADDFGADGPSNSAITITAGPTNGGAVVNDNGSPTDPTDDYIVYTPAGDYNGPDNITYEICDANGDCDQAIVSITVSADNDPPVVDNENITIDEDNPATGDLTDAGDSDVDGSLVVNTTPIYGPNDGSIVINPDGTFTYDPDPDFNGADTIVVEICDDGTPLPAECVNDTIFITVNPINDSPAQGNETAVTDEDNNITGIDLDDNNTDPDGDALTVTFPGGLTGTGGGTFTDNGDGTVDYIPLPDFNGMDTLFYTVCDPTPACVTDTLVITVNPINDAPVVDNEIIVIDEDNPATGDLTDAGDSDVDGTLIVNTTPIYGPNDGSIVINPDGTFTYDPDPDFFGNDTIIVEICDDGTPLPAECVNDTIFITVNPINDSPAQGNETAVTDEDNNITGIDLDDNNTDPDGDAITVTFPGGLTGTGGGTFTDNGDGTVDYTPLPDFYGTDTLFYTVCDPTPACVTDTLVVTVNPINDAPVVDNEIIVIDEDNPATGDLTDAGDYDVDGSLVVNTTPIYGPNDGSITINPDGTFTYDPDPDFFGNDTIIVEICDDGTPLPAECVNDTIFITVNPINDPPAQGNETATTDEDNGLTNIDLDDNNTDPDGDVVTVSFPGGVTGTGGGTFTDNGDGTVDYTPLPDFYGTDTLFYTVCDPTPECVTDTLVVTVNPINDSPVVDNEYIGTLMDTPYDGDLIDAGDTDVDGTLTANTTPISGPTNGSIIISPDGSYTYTPDLGYLGNDTVVVEICDDGFPLPAICVNDTIFIVVTDNNTPVDDGGDGNENMTATEDGGATDSPNVLDNNTDPEGDPMDVIIIDPGSGTAVYNPSDSTITYTPAPDFCGLDTVLYDVCDAYTCNSDTLFIDVECVNDAPTGGNETVTVPEDDPGTTTDNILDNDDDIDGDDLTVTVPGTSTGGGTVIYNPSDSTITYIPLPNFCGEDTIVYEVCDDAVPTPECIYDTVFITVTCINDPLYAVNDTVTVVEDNILNGTTVLVNDGDDDGSLLTVNTTPVSDVTNGTLVLSGDGTFTYTPDPGYTGDDSFVYEVSNDESPQEFATAEVYITVTPFINNNPEVAEDTISTTTPQDTPIEICIDATDIDGDTLDITSYFGGPDNGIITGISDSDTCFTYIPDTDYSGTDTVIVVVDDGHGGTDTVFVVIVVTPIEIVPVAHNDHDTISTDTLIIDVLVNDENITDSTDIAVIIDPGNGTTYIDGDNNIVYIPDFGYCGDDLFTYEICNTSGDCSQAIVFLNVIPTDSDGDGISNYNETLTADTDADGILNYLDLDSDDDGIPDSVEMLGDTSDICNPVIADSDGDGVPDYTDTDSDNDGIPDKDENDIDGDGYGPDDSDGDGIPDYRDPNMELFIPEGFSPNGDGTNDYFEIIGLELYNSNSIVIYNRWGNKVYEASPYNNDWDGKNMFGISIGDDLPVGTYFYIIELEHESSEIIKGYIYLNR